MRAVERVDDRRADELAEPAGLDQIVGGGDDGTEALLEADAERSSRPVGGVDHLVGLSSLDSERLLDEDVRAGLERLDREPRVGGMRRTDDDDVR